MKAFETMGENLKKETKSMQEQENYVMLAILNGKKYIDIDGTEFNLPEPQRSGTGYQQETYARLKARELINIITDFKNI